jgi:hypothetical protein
MTRKRWLGLLVAALLVPLPAFALSGGSSAAALNVSVSNAGCGIGGGSAVVCRLQVSFNQIPGATRYTAAVSGPDGSVADYGAIGPGGATITVPYTGNGTYSVSISAWGDDTTHHRHAKPLATDSTGAVKDAQATMQASAGARDRSAIGHHAQAQVSRSTASRDANLGGDASATVDSGSTSTDTQPDCPPAPPPPPPTTTTPPPPTTTPTTTTPDGGTTTTPTTTTAPPPGQVQAEPPPPGCPSP